MLPLERPAARHLVGVSGGADSVALLHLLVEGGSRNLVVCHLHHGLRGRDATTDKHFTARLAKQLGLPFETGRVDVRKLAKASGESLETAARHARHEFFARCAKLHRCPRVILAHHADDQAETILWNLLRGSHGPKGMSANQHIMAGGRQLVFLRPLLDTRRADLRVWLTQHGHPWREDATNADPFATRNRLRNEGIPLLADIARRDIIPALLRAAEAADNDQEIINWALGQIRVTDPQGRIHLPALRELPPALQRAALHQYLAENHISGLDRALLDRALALTDPLSPPSVNLPGGHHLRRREGRLLITASEATRPISR
jgi:tRNA(Ile)-lysidine synthase